MTDDKKQQELFKTLFVNLIMMLGSTTMQQLGKLVNPLTSKTEVDLQGAQTTIDMISMLQNKTTGNLDSDEEKTISDILSSLQMNYVETANAPSEPDKEDDKKEPAVESKEAATEEKDPKFHKSYENSDDSKE